MHTIHGEVNEKDLDKKSGVVENERELTTWVEYRLKGKDEIVRRDVHVTLKQPAVFADAEAASF